MIHGRLKIEPKPAAVVKKSTAGRSPCSSGVQKDLSSLRILVLLYLPQKLAAVVDQTLDVSFVSAKASQDVAFCDRQAFVCTPLDNAQRVVEVWLSKALCKTADRCLELVESDAEDEDRAGSGYAQIDVCTIQAAEVDQVFSAASEVAGLDLPFDGLEVFLGGHADASVKSYVSSNHSQS